MFQTRRQNRANPRRGRRNLEQWSKLKGARGDPRHAKWPPRGRFPLLPSDPLSRRLCSRYGALRKHEQNVHWRRCGVAPRAVAASLPLLVSSSKSWAPGGPPSTGAGGQLLGGKSEFTPTESPSCEMERCDFTRGGGLNSRNRIVSFLLCKLGCQVATCPCGKYGVLQGTHLQRPPECARASSPRRCSPSHQLPRPRPHPPSA